MQSQKRHEHVFIISDATGATAERVINAALVQFEDVVPVFKKFPFVKTTAEIDEILASAQQLDAIVIYSLVSREIREWIHANKHRWRIYLIDLLGPILKDMERLWHMIPKLRPGILEGVGEETYRLANSIDYSLKHDDGQNIDTIGLADLVILGLSRTSKTPTSLYLACNHNLKVANVPIVIDTPLPEEINTIRAPIIGFTIEAKRLALLRSRRLLYAGAADYSDLESIQAEILCCNKIYRQIRGLHIINVTYHPIEEIAKSVLQSARLI
ncbi:MAG: kinase/pyrophosphorylase [Desulfobacteraceae bacterium]|nr:kinase/pyrophosphorylase [Desulfobacteraceae bacterium]